VALSVLQQCKEHLSPLGIAADELADTAPIYTAIFTFADEAGDIRLTVSWEAMQDSESDRHFFNQLSRKWTRLDRDTKSASSLLDISLSDLSSSSAWAFSIKAALALDEKRVPLALQHFADSLRIDPTAASKRTADSTFVLFNAYAPNTKLRHLQQRVQYRYCVQGWDYNLELYHFQDRSYPERSTNLLQPSSVGAVKVYEARWALDVYGAQWDQMLAFNENLKVGDVAEWEASGESFFPKGYNCSADKEPEIFNEFMDKLNEISNVVMSAKIGDLMDGMTVD